MNIGKVFFSGGDVHYILPRFQRAYAWEQRHWQTLWEDVLAICALENQSHGHFLGAMVVIGEGMLDATLPAYTLVDGQQRLLTISILLRALFDRMSEKRHRRQVLKYLVNDDRDGSLRYKVLPTENFEDRSVWQTLVAGGQVDENSKSRVHLAYEYFSSKIEGVLQCEALEATTLFNTIVSGLHIVFINLDREERPHQIFESLNAKGLDLSQADLVRNYLAMRLPETRVNDAYGTHWRQVEDLLSNRPEAELEAFLRHYLARYTRSLYREDEIYEKFRNRMDNEFREETAFLEEIATLHRHAEYYDRLLRPAHEQNEALRVRFERINALQRTVVYPLLLGFYDAYNRKILEHDAFCELLDLVENYLVRHYLVDAPSGALNRMLPALIQNDNRVGDLKFLKQGLFSRSYPVDEHIREVLGWRWMYAGGANRKRLVYILMRINQHLLRDKDVKVILGNEPTIEHILPRSLNRSWQNDLGKAWESVHETYLNTLGNLTLVSRSWNTSLSNSVWKKKKALLQEHGLPINHFYFSSGKPGDIEHWNEQAILDRNEWLVDRLLELWSDKGSSRVRNNSQYDPDRHPNTGIDYTGSKVANLTLHGTTWKIPRHSWNKLVALFSNKVAVPRQDFADIAAQLPDELASQRRNDWDQELENGWWVCYMRANYATWYLSELAELCDLPDQDWHITLNQ